MPMLSLCRMRMSRLTVTLRFNFVSGVSFGTAGRAPVNSLLSQDAVQSALAGNYTKTSLNRMGL